MATTNGLFIGLGAATLASALCALAVVSTTGSQKNAQQKSAWPLPIPEFASDSNSSHSVIQGALPFLGALSPHPSDAQEGINVHDTEGYYT